MRAFNETKETLVGTGIKVADKFWTRLVGLLGHKGLDKGTGLLLSPCKGVHGWGMAFTCEVIYLDRLNKVLYVQTLRPWQRAPYLKQAWQVLEMPVGTLEITRTEPGDIFRLERTPPFSPE